MKEQKELDGDGDCYEANAKWILNRYVFQLANPDGVFLCHGKVRGGKGTKVEGLIFGHCWVEVGDLFMDFAEGKEFIIRKEIQYAGDDIIADSVKRYTPSQVVKMIVKYKHYGAWKE